MSETMNEILDEIDSDVDPVEIVRELIANSHGYLGFGTVSSPSPAPINHHFGKLSEKDIADNIVGEHFRDDPENDGWPFISLAQVAFAGTTPIILMSNMTDHTRNIVNDNRVSLLIDGTTGDNRMNSARVALMGKATVVDKQKYRDVFLAQHPKAKSYFDFKDFNLYAVEISHARLNAGFGLAFWLDGSELR